MRVATVVLPNTLREVKPMIENIAAVDSPKTTGRKKSTYTDEQRKKHCKEYHESGLSFKSCCELNNVSESALRKWIRKFHTKSFFRSVSPSLAFDIA